MLPPPKEKMDPTDAAAILAYADGFVNECINARRGEFKQAQRNFNLYLGNHWTTVAPDESDRYVFNRVKSVVISHAAIQQGQRPEIKFSPRETGEEGIRYIDLRVFKQLVQKAMQPAPPPPEPAPADPNNPEAAAAPALPPAPPLTMILSQIPTECVTPDPTTPGGGPKPLTPEVYGVLRQAIDQGNMLTERAMSLNLPPPDVIPEELICEVNDAECAEALQTLFDAKWEECNADFFVLTDAFYNGIIGWQHMFYRWDENTESHALYNCEFQQVFVDPTRIDVSLAGTVIWDYYMSADQGIADYPKYADVIRSEFRAGTPIPAGATPYTPASIYLRNTYFREMGAIRFMWVRNQPYPMDPAEAIDRGLIIKGRGPEEPHVQLPTDTAPGENEVRPGDDGGAGDGSGEGAGAGKPPEDAGGPEDLGTQSGGGETPTGSPIEGGPVDALPGAVGDLGIGDRVDIGDGKLYRVAYLLVVNGAPGPVVEPWSPLWPMRKGVREFVIINSKLVDDHEVPEIPLTHNVNDPIPGRPTGQGTPEMLEPIQMALNQFLSDMIHQVSTGSFPTYLIPESVQKARGELSEQAYIKPGTVLTIPDTLMQTLKDDIIRTLEPGAVSADLWRFLTMLLDLIDKQGEMANVLQGSTESGMSGKLFNDATSAAQTSILFRSRRAEMMLKGLAKLMMGGLYRMSPESSARCVRKYPVYVWYAIHKWWNSGYFECDISTSITSGGGANKQAKANQMAQAKQMGVDVSQTKLLKALDIDPDQNIKDEADYQRKRAAMMPQPQVMPGGDAKGEGVDSRQS